MIWHSTHHNQVITELNSSETQGLSSAAVAERQQIYGKNELRQKEGKNLFQKFLDQLKDFMVIVLIIAAIVSCITSLLTHEPNGWIEPVVIIAIVLLNAFLGVVQENKAESALAALKSMAAPSAKVLRDGVQSVIPAVQLVPGDIILLEAGDFIPADARLIESQSLHSQESALTGESVPVEKDASFVGDDITGLADRKNMVYSGCSITYGRGRAIVTATGMDTEMGKIATQLDNTEETTTPLQIKLAELGKMLGTLALIICAIIFVVGFIMGVIDGDKSFLDIGTSMFMTAVSLAVAAIPEGLPAIVTIVLAIGVNRMVKKNAIIRRMPAVETLGSASVICSDKTGTLTLNKMTMVKVYDGHEIVDIGENPSPAVAMLLRLGCMCCDADVRFEKGKEIQVGDPTEAGIVSACMRYVGMSKADMNNAYPRLGEIPFDSDRKLMTTINMIDGKPYAVVKGAPDVLLSLCISGDIERANAANEAMGKLALRVLGVAIKPLDDITLASNPTSEMLENDLTFVGLLGMIDPPRPEAAEAVKKCHSAGIRTVMITGDHIVTASTIATQLGILTPDKLAITGSELSKLTDEELCENIEKYAVYARVSPEDKIRIVSAWQKRGHIVAMTGDGVNDAPALKAADIGCAMGITGTDVAKGASDMTLTDDNFATIVSAIEEGRGIFDNIRKAVHFLLSCNLGEIITVFFGMFIWHESPLLSIQLLWLNLVTDSLPALSLGMEPIEKSIMKRKPRDKNESVFSGGLGIDALWQGFTFGVITLIAYGIGLALGGSAVYARTMAFVVLACAQLVHAYNVRSQSSLFKLGLFSNKYMNGAFIISLLLIVLVVATPINTVFGMEMLNMAEVAAVIGLSIIPLILSELVKFIRKHKTEVKK